MARVVTREEYLESEVRFLRDQHFAILNRLQAVQALDKKELEEIKKEAAIFADTEQRNWLRENNLIGISHLI